MQKFLVIPGTVLVDTVITRQAAVDYCMKHGKPVAFQDKLLNCYRVLFPGTLEDFTAVMVREHPIQKKFWEKKYPHYQPII